MERIPRPLGATMLSKQYQLNCTKDGKHKLRKCILTAYINQMLYTSSSTHTNLKIKPKANTYSAKQKKKLIDTNKEYKEVRMCTIEEVSIGLGIDLIKCSHLINKLIYRLAKNNVRSKGYEEVNIMATRVELLRAQKIVLDRYPTHIGWGEELKAVARLNGYNALQTKEANSAVNNEISYISMVHKMLTSNLPMQPKIAIQNNYQDLPNTSENGMMLTTTQAVQLLEEKGFTQQALNLDLLRELHGLDDPSIPNIKALPEDSQGTISINTKDLQYLNHENRRADQEGIIPNIDGVPIKAKKAKKGIAITLKI